MAKKKAASSKKPKAGAKRKNWSASRGRTVGKGNSAAHDTVPVAPEPEERVNIGEAMRLAVEKLGDITIDSTLAPKQMRELGEIVEDIARRQAAYDARAEEAKTAKKSLESAQELLIERCRAFTHPSPLPLFDQTEREQDLAKMTDDEHGEVEPVVEHASV